MVIYSLSAFSFAIPQAMEVLSDCIWRPRITREEVIFLNPVLYDYVTSERGTLPYNLHGLMCPRLEVPLYEE